MKIENIIDHEVLGEGIYLEKDFSLLLAPASMCTKWRLRRLTKEYEDYNVLSLPELHHHLKTVSLPRWKESIIETKITHGDKVYNNIIVVIYKSGFAHIRYMNNLSDLTIEGITISGDITVSQSNMKLENFMFIRKVPNNWSEDKKVLYPSDIEKLLKMYKEE